MSKVICDVCGTTYPETAAQCPICGSAKNTAEQTAAAPTEGTEESTSSYAYVKGGRFSKKNVRRRSQGRKTPTTAQRRSSAGSRSTSSRTVREDEEPNNTGLIIVVILLLIAIAAVVVYLILPFFQGDTSSEPKDTTGSTVQSPAPSESENNRIPCTAIQVLPKMEIGLGESHTLTIQLLPENTNDTVKFVSENPAIAAVDADTGEVTMLAEGEAVITVICGNVTAQCTVKTPEKVDPGPGPDDPVTPGEFKFEFNTIYKDDKGNGDTTLERQGETWKAYKSSLDIDPALITWTSDNPAIATVEKGIVTAVAPGTTKIHAQYNGVTYTCVIRCTFEVRPDANDCAPNIGDTTIVVGESFKLKLKDTNGQNLKVTWKCDTDGVTIEAINEYETRITGAVSGTHKVYCEYGGKTYTCIVRIK